MIFDFQETNAEKLNEKHLFVCTYLNSEEFFMNEFEKSLLFLNDLRGTHFKKLTFSGTGFPLPGNEIHETLRHRIYQPLYNFMSSLTNLTTFHSIRMCDDTMFELFGTHCPNLQEIEVELSYTLSDEGISYLCGFNTCAEIKSYLRTGELIQKNKGCKNLKRIILDFTMASNISVAALLQYCSKLEILNVNPDINVGEVFTMLYGYDTSTFDFVTKKYNLTSLRSTLEIDENVFSLITQTCPNLNDVALRCYGIERKDKNLLASLLRLSIHSLDLMNCNTMPLLWYLTLKGISIYKLVIEHLLSAPQSVYLNRSHLQSIISACPNLTHFSLKMCGNMSISPNVPYSHFGKDLHYFTTLKELLIEGVNLQQSDLKVLLSQCKDIENVSIMCQSLEILEDAFLYELLSKGALKNLKSFYVSRPLLTFAGLQRLLSECPDLEKVGPLSSWAIPKKEREKLLQDIKNNNWKLNIESPEMLHNFFF